MANLQYKCDFCQRDFTSHKERKHPRFCRNCAELARLIRKWVKNDDMVKVVIDGVHTDFFDKPLKKGFKKELGIPEDSPLIIFTGALLAAKGIWNLVNAIPMVLKERKDTHFLQLKVCPKVVRLMPGCGKAKLALINPHLIQIHVYHGLSQFRQAKPSCLNPITVSNVN